MRLLAHEGFDGPGGAVPLLVAHGLFGSARNWRAIARMLAADRRVVAVDMRNHGQSFRDPAQDYPAMAADLAEAINQLCGGTAHVLGHSMGGKAAMALALGDPGRVARLVVADIAPVAYRHSHSAHIAALRRLDLASLRSRAEADAALAPLMPDAGLRAFLLQSLRIEATGNSWALNLDALDAAMPVLVGWPGLAGAFRHPALFLSGAASDYVRPEHHPAILAQFPAARFEAIAGAGHWLHAEQPKAFVAAVAGFLNAQADPAA